MRYVPALALAATILALQANALAVVPDNGGGTADMPLQTPYIHDGVMQITNGLVPVGSTIDIVAVLHAPTSTTEVPGGTLGGTIATANAPIPTWTWSMTGTGAFTGYNRVVNMPLSTLQEHTAPRTAFSPVQSFDTTLFMLQGQLPPGDPDFDLLRVTSGDNFGMPSPGHTTLYQDGPNWLVDSFFDITYRIDFVGHAGGPFSGMSGSSQAIIRIYATDLPEPTTLSLFALGALPLLRRRKH